MRFARARARKEKKAARKGRKEGVKDAAKIRQSVKTAYVNQYRADLMRRKITLHNLSACFLLTMHDGYGFGRGRLLRLRDKMQSIFDSLVAKTVSVEEIAAYLREDLKMDVGVDAFDPTASHDRQIEIRCIKEMSSAFLMALLDEFDFKRKRLTDAYTMVCELSDSVGRHETTYEAICEKLGKVMSQKTGNGRKTRFRAVTQTLR